VSEGQTLRNEDNAFLPLSSRRILLLCRFCQSNKALCQAAEITLKQHVWVSSPLQVRPSLMFNCGIRDYSVHHDSVSIEAQARRSEGKKDVQGSMFQVQRFDSFPTLSLEL